MRRIAILDAPSNLGLRPPTVTSVPGCAKAPGALRDHGLLTRLHARDAGCLTAPRYDPGDWRPGDGVCHATEIAAYSRKLADRIGAIIDAGEFPVVLGGDCSIVLGSGLAMHRLGEAVGGRIGLVFVDGHSDFRHPGNASYVGAAAGEDLALVTGRGQTDLAAIEGRRPYFRDVDVVVMGIRAQDEYRLDLQAAGILTRPVPTLRVEGAARSAQWARDQLVDCAGYWVHVDMDVLDPAVMPAVDAPEPGGIAFPELELLLAGLVDTPHCLGVEITVFDPDYDADGAYAEEITSAIVAGLAPVRTVARPDLIAARQDLAARSDTPAADERGAERFGPGRLGPGRLGPARSAPASPEPERPEPEGPEPEGPAPGRLPPAAAAADTEDQRDVFAARRAAAAAQSVTLAAAGMSQGGSPDQDGDAVPATTLLGVEEADEVESRSATEGLPDDRTGSSDENRDAGEDPVEKDEPRDEDVPQHPRGATGHAEDGDDGAAGPTVHAPDEDVTAQHGDEVYPEGRLRGRAGPDSAAGQDDDDPREDRPAGDPDAADEGQPPRADGIPVQPVSRPLGSAPLLDSQPLPATRPGMLRPRTVDGFSLPAQRPAFDAGPGEPADIA